MDQEFFERKIKELSDDKLIELFNFQNDANHEILELAKEESKRRNLKITLPDSPSRVTSDDETEDRRKLKKWNWGAFILGPIWALANKLDKWSILYFIPLVNVFVVFYLGSNGNKLAYDKSNIGSVDDFMLLQRQWNIWGIRIFWISITATIVWLLIEVSA